MDDIEYQLYKVSETPSHTYSVSEQTLNINQVPMEPPLRMKDINGMATAIQSPLLQTSLVGS